MSTIANIQSSSSSTAAHSNPVLPSSHSQLSNTAVKLSTESSIVANLGGGNSSTTPLYSAVGLLNTISQAGAGSNSGSTATQTTAPTTATSQTTPTSTTTGSTNTNHNWASILAATPQAASALAAYTTNQGIVSTLSTIA